MIKIDWKSWKVRFYIFSFLIASFVFFKFRVDYSVVSSSAYQTAISYIKIEKEIVDNVGEVVRFEHLNATIDTEKGVSIFKLKVFGKSSEAIVEIYLEKRGSDSWKVASWKYLP